MLTRLYCGDHFAVYSNAESCTPETNIMCVNCTSINKKMGKKIFWGTLHVEVKLGLLYDKQHEDFDSIEFNFLISNLSEIEVFPESGSGPVKAGKIMNSLVSVRNCREGP